MTDTDKSSYVAWATHLHQTWTDENWPSFKFRAFKLPYASMTRISNVEIDEIEQTTSFTIGDARCQINSVGVLENDLWHCELYSTNISLIYSGSPAKPQLRAAAVATKHATPQEAENDQSLAAFQYYGQVFDKYSREGLLLYVEDGAKFDRTFEGQLRQYAWVQFELIVLILAAEPNYSFTVYSRSTCQGYKQIWPTQCNSGYMKRHNRGEFEYAVALNSVRRTIGQISRLAN